MDKSHKSDLFPLSQHFEKSNSHIIHIDHYVRNVMPQIASLIYLKLVWKLN